MKNKILPTLAISFFMANSAGAEEAQTPSLFGLENACHNIDDSSYNGILSPEVAIGIDPEANEVVIYRCATELTYGRSCSALAFLTAARNGMSQSLINDGRDVLQVNDYFNRMENALTTYCVSSHNNQQAPA